MEVTCQGPKQRGAGLRAMHAETQPLPAFLPASFNKDSLTQELIFFCCYISKELKAPERLFIESAFECMLQHR